MDPTERLTDLPGWSRDGEAITKTYKLRDFTSAMAFVNDVADIAESANHHPDIDIRWNRVRLTLSTHSAGRLTELDLDVADRIERVFGGSHAPTDQS
jgi:4a-hydroxytetrahydrobiopterin dehydratase